MVEALLGILFGILMLSGLGFIFGLGLAFVAKIFHVEISNNI